MTKDEQIQAAREELSRIAAIKEQLFFDASHSGKIKKLMRLVKSEGESAPTETLFGQKVYCKVFKTGEATLIISTCNGQDHLRVTAGANETVLCSTADGLYAAGNWDSYLLELSDDTELARLQAEIAKGTEELGDL